MKKVLFVFLLTCSAIPGSGYIAQKKLLDNALLQVRWPSSTISWRLVPTQPNTITGTRNLSQATDASFATWDAVSTANITLTRGADAASSASFGFDGVNIVKTNVTAAEYASAGFGEALAVTSTSIDPLTGE